MVFAVIGAAIAVIIAMILVGRKILDAIRAQTDAVAEQTATIKAIDEQRRSDEEKRHSFEGLRKRAEELERSIGVLRELPHLNTGRLAVAMAEAEMLNEMLFELREGVRSVNANMARYRETQSRGNSQQNLIDAAQDELNAFFDFIDAITEKHDAALARVERLRENPTA